MSFFDVLLAKQLSGGGGGGSAGLEFETGEYISGASRISKVPVQFANSHNSAPSIVIFATTLESVGVSRIANEDVLFWTFWDYYKLFGGSCRAEASDGYALILASRWSRGSNYSMPKALPHKSSEIGEDATYPNYYATNSGFNAYYDDTRTFAPRASYKWIAIWL